MSFLDSNGLSHFYDNLKTQFPQMVESVGPDSSGNITLSNVVKFSEQPSITAGQQRQA